MSSSAAESKVRYIETQEGQMALASLRKKYFPKGNKRVTAIEFERIASEIVPSDLALMIPIRERNTWMLMEMLAQVASPTYSGDDLLNIVDLQIEQVKIKERIVVGTFLTQLFDRVQRAR